METKAINQRDNFQQKKERKICSLIKQESTHSSLYPQNKVFAPRYDTFESTESVYGNSKSKKGTYIKRKSNIPKFVISFADHPWKGVRS